MPCGEILPNLPLQSRLAKGVANSIQAPNPSIETTVIAVAAAERGSQVRATRGRSCQRPLRLTSRCSRRGFAAFRERALACGVVGSTIGAEPAAPRG